MVPLNLPLSNQPFFSAVGNGIGRRVVDGVLAPPVRPGRQPDTEAHHLLQSVPWGASVHVMPSAQLAADGVRHRQEGHIGVPVHLVDVEQVMHQTH